MVSRYYRAYAAVAALSSACALWGGTTGCVQQRPARNGVFNENQYLRKDFLIAPGDGSVPDEGWFVKSTIVAATTPNVLGNADGAYLFAGAEGSGANFVQFMITQDKLQMVNLREISNSALDNSQGLSTPEIVNAWPITNVDLKYQVNLDGEKTNFFQENQELDWQVRQWVKLNFAKNDLSDLYAFGANTNPVIQNCVDTVNASVTLVTDSFNVDTVNDTFEFTLSLTAPIAFNSIDTGTGVSVAATCMAAFGPAATTFFQMGRQNVTLNLRTMFVRPSKVIDGTYVPFPIAEKDPIQHKYGAFEVVVPFRDTNTGLLSAQQFVGRFNPNNDIVYYFAKGMPKIYTDFFAAPGGLVDSTNNNILAKTGAKGRLKMLNYNDATKYLDGAGPERTYGDPRYSFINWHSDLDSGSQLLGIAQFFTDPRTGETISASVNLWEGPFQDTVQQRLDLFLQTVGAEYLLPDGEFDDSKYPASCSVGETIPVVPADVANAFNRQSTVYSKMQGYLQQPFAQYGYLGPSNFIPPHDTDFYNAYYAVIPYQIYSDPQLNPFVTPQAGSFDSTADVNNWAALQNVVQFQQLAGSIDQGLAPYETSGATDIPDAVNFMNNWSTLARATTDYENTRHYAQRWLAADDLSLYSYMDVYQKNGRHCVATSCAPPAGTGEAQAPAWETRACYTQNLITSLNESTVAHEFGHTLGLRHNFMGSVDQRNYPLTTSGVCTSGVCAGPNNGAACTTSADCQTPLMYSASLMDYNQMISEAFFETTSGSQIWGPYDAAAIAWIYSNDLSTTTLGPVATTTAANGISGQVSATAPWNDPLGWQGTGTAAVETPFLFCTDEHVKYTPLCRRYDMGATPSEIMANDLQRREWNYLWTNFRLYHKYFTTENYATSVANDFNEMRRFTSLWAFDWSGGELTNDLRLIGITSPSGDAADYFAQLTGKFNTDISIANQLQATYHRAIIEQSSGERPYITAFDPFYGDVTQQGIQLDKVQATTSMSELWPAVSNYDPSQSSGSYISSVGGQVGDSAYTTVSQEVLADFLGASFATYTYSQVGPIANFANSTHSGKFNGNYELQTWIGGWVFNRDIDFLDFTSAIAVANNFQNCDENGANCNPCTALASLNGCSWDPRTLAVTSNQLTQSTRYNTFQGPDGRTYIWGYIPSRNQWVLADRDRNNATYTLMLSWTTDVVNGEDDGYNGALYLEYKVRYIIDAFTYYDGSALAAD